jgi:hypothetical protein
MRLRASSWLAAVVLAACGAEVVHVRQDQPGVPHGSGVVIGRFGFATRRRIEANRFELVAVQIPSGDKFAMKLAADAEGEGTSAPFFVNLPPGKYRLTRWTVASPAHEWGGDDTGLAIEATAGTVMCVGGLYLQPQERALMFADDRGPAPSPEVRDECDALVALLRARAPSLAQTPVVALARSVVARPARAASAQLGP